MQCSNGVLSYCIASTKVTVYSVVMASSAGSIGIAELDCRILLHIYNKIMLR